MKPTWLIPLITIVAAGIIVFDIATVIYVLLDIAFKAPHA